MGNKKGLGRSFSSLIPTELLDESFDPTAAQDEQVSELRHIKLTEIDADPEQPRRHFDESALDELAVSVKEHGILQPIVVTPQKGRYVIVAGERRFRASQRAGLSKIPALVRTLSGQHKLELSLIENLQRRDLNALETATAYLKLRDQFNLTLEEIGRRVGGKSVSAVSNTLRLLRLPESVRVAIAEGKLTEGQARPLVNLDKKVIDELLPQILREEWSARRIEQVIVQLRGEHTTSEVKKSRPTEEQPHTTDMNRLKSWLNTEVKIRTNSRGAGQIVIGFKNQEEFDRIQSLLK